MITELTSGTFGKWLWYRYCFWISFDNGKITIKTPFKKRIIPLDMVEKLSSTKLLFIDGLRLFHHTPNVSQRITFISVNPKGWFEAFEESGVKTEDPQNLRTTSMGLIKFFKYTNLFAGFLGLIAAIVALVVVLVGIFVHFFQ